MNDKCWRRETRFHSLPRSFNRLDDVSAASNECLTRENCRVTEDSASGPPMKTNRVSGVIVVWFVVIGDLTITAAAIYVFSKHKHAFDYPAFCHEKLHNLSVALFAYQEAFGTFPPAFLPDAQGKPVHSWRVILLPYLKENGTKDLYDFYRFNEPWDGPSTSVSERTTCPSPTNVLRLNEPKTFRVHPFRRGYRAWNRLARRSPRKGHSRGKESDPC